MLDDPWTEAAAWVQAVGTIGALIGAAWVAAGDSRASRRREERNRLEAIERDSRSLVASRAAALNLAIMAATRIRELHALLRDETRRGRVTRVSPSRTLATTEHMLTAFPIQSLCDADAMVAFSYFPGALATAAEIYANLEAEVRAAADNRHAEIFGSYARQMSLLERTSKLRLGELRRALNIVQDPEADPSDPAQDRGGAPALASSATLDDHGRHAA